MSLELVPTEEMTPDEIEAMKKIMTQARTNISKAFEELKTLAFHYDQFIIASKFDDAEKIMAKFAVLSTAFAVWREACPHLGDFEDAYEALYFGIIMSTEKMNAKKNQENKLES